MLKVKLAIVVFFAFLVGCSSDPYNTETLCETAAGPASLRLLRFEQDQFSLLPHSGGHIIAWGIVFSLVVQQAQRSALLGADQVVTVEMQGNPFLMGVLVIVLVVIVIMVIAPFVQYRRGLAGGSNQAEILDTHQHVASKATTYAFVRFCYKVGDRDVSKLAVEHTMLEIQRLWDAAPEEVRTFYGMGATQLDERRVIFQSTIGCKLCPTNT